MGAVIHNVMVLLSCGLVRYTSSFLPVFSVSSTFPNQHSLPVYHFLIFFLAASFFGVEQMVIVLEFAAFSRLADSTNWFLTSDSQSFYSGMDTLWYSSVDYFLSSTQLGVVLLRRAGSGEYSFRYRSSMGLLIRLPFRRTTLIPASSSKRENGLTVLVHLHRTTIFPSSSSKTRCSLTVRVHLLRSTASPAHVSFLLHFRNHGGFVFRGDYLSGGSFIVFTIIRIRS